MVLDSATVRRRTGATSSEIARISSESWSTSRVTAAPSRMTAMFASTTASPLRPNFLTICWRTFSRMSSREAPAATRSTCAATAPMNAIPIMRVSSSGVGACCFATAKASTMKKRIPFSLIVRRALRGSSRQTCSGVSEVCSMKVPPSASPLSGSVCEKTL